MALSQQSPIKSSAGQSCQVEIAAVGVGPCFPNATASGLSLNSQLPSAVLSSVVFFFLFVGVFVFFLRGIMLGFSLIFMCFLSSMLL